MCSGTSGRRSGPRLRAFPGFLRPRLCFSRQLTGRQRPTGRAGAERELGRAAPSRRRERALGAALIKELAEYLGHADPVFTLRVYTHLLPSSHDRARQVKDDRFTRMTPDPASLGLKSQAAGKPERADGTETEQATSAA